MKVLWHYVFSFLFIYLLFLLRTNSTKENLDENNFPHCYGNFFKIAVLKVTCSQLYLKFFLNNNEAHRLRHLRDTLQFKILQKWINLYANSLLIKRHETKIETGGMKFISCTKIRVCTSKIIAPKQKMTFHLLLYASLTFKQT